MSVPTDIDAAGSQYHIVSGKMQQSGLQPCLHSGFSLLVGDWLEVYAVAFAAVHGLLEMRQQVVDAFRFEVRTCDERQ